MYYLQSRYYDPEVGRFLNADAFPSTGQGLTGNNMFAYCGNNPISRTDTGGKFWNIVGAVVVGSIVGAIASVVTEVTTAILFDKPITLNETIAAAASGAVTGGMQALGVPSVVASTVGTAVGTVVNGVLDGDDIITIVKDTARESLNTAITGIALEAPGRLLKNYFGGKYFKQGPVERFVGKLLNEGKYVNEFAASTIVSSHFWDSVTSIIVDAVKHTAFGM